MTHPNLSVALFLYFDTCFSSSELTQSKSKSGSMWCTTLSLQDMNWVCFIWQLAVELLLYLLI